MFRQPASDAQSIEHSVALEIPSDQSLPDLSQSNVDRLMTKSCNGMFVLFFHAASYIFGKT
jgi:hypothetical protein